MINKMAASRPADLQGKLVTKILFFFVVCTLVWPALQSKILVSGEKFFDIDYLNNTFVKDGRVFRYVSGSFHYSRVHPYYWQDRLLKAKVAGLNAIQTYIPWNVHELKQGHFTWTGASDLPRFLTLAQKLDLAVLLRLGPYICGEWEFGGFPAWLLTIDPTMPLRTSNPTYMKYVTLWYREMFSKIRPFLYENGGPVVMVQIENEYGSYYACDQEYTGALRDLVRSELSDKVIIYTTDGAGDGYLKCGKVYGVYATVDFGVTYNPSGAFKAQRDYEPLGPLVNSEYYTGWLDHWGTPHSVTSVTATAYSLDLLLDYGANINMYMFVGGTNFGFYNGANSPPYQPVPTSYDYDSPISESGDITMKYLAIRDIISKYFPLPSMPIPENTPKAKYGSVQMEFICTVQDALDILSPSPVESRYPVPMEQIEFIEFIGHETQSGHTGDGILGLFIRAQYHGFILYRFELQQDYRSPANLSVEGVRDRAMVMVNGVPFGILDRTVKTYTNITGTKGQYVDILVENQGRIGYGTYINFNQKGITSNVTLNGEVVTDWTLFPLHMENINNTLLKKSKSRSKSPPLSSDGQWTTPSIFMGDLYITGQPNDTFLDPSPWGKGQAFINDFNIGRYWPYRGPQVRLFVPKPILKSNANQIYLFELEAAPCKYSEFCIINFVDTPYLDGPNNPDAVDGAIRDLGLPPNYNDPNAHLVH